MFDARQKTELRPTIRCLMHRLFCVALSQQHAQCLLDVDIYRNGNVQVIVCAGDVKVAGKGM